MFSFLYIFISYGLVCMTASLRTGTNFIPKSGYLIHERLYFERPIPGIVIDSWFDLLVIETDNQKKNQVNIMPIDDLASFFKMKFPHSLSRGDT